VPANSIAAYGVYSQQVQLQTVVATLNQAGFRNQDICLLLAPAHPITTRVHDIRSLVDESDSSAVLAGLVGWLSRLGAVSVSGVGLFIRSRAYLQALMDASEMPATNRNRRALANLGIPEQEAERLGKRISDDGGLIYVACEGTSESQRVMDILRNTGAQETSCLQQLAQGA
jgi:hypothetical protein